MPNQVFKCASHDLSDAIAELIQSIFMANLFGVKSNVGQRGETIDGLLAQGYDLDTISKKQHHPYIIWNYMPRVYKDDTGTYIVQAEVRAFKVAGGGERDDHL